MYIHTYVIYIYTYNLSVCVSISYVNMYMYIYVYTICMYEYVFVYVGFPDGSVVKNLPDTDALGLIPGLGRSPGGSHGNPLQYACLENPMDGGTWRSMVHRVA